MSTEKEQQRYAAINAQIKEQLDAAVNDRNPMTAMARALLCSRLYKLNEQAHQHALSEVLAESIKKDREE